jgi:alkylhydroperoxidase family enzyme
MAARVRSLGPEDWGADVEALLAPTLAPVAALEGRGDDERQAPLEILTVMAHNPALLGAFIPWASALVFNGALARRQHELLALRAASNCGSAFEWAHHVVYGHAAGLDDEEVARVASGPAAPGWRDEDALLLQAADELHVSSTISDATFAALERHLTAAALVEVPWVVGQYTMLSMLANATGIGTGPGDAPLPPGRGAPRP